MLRRTLPVAAFVLTAVSAAACSSADPSSDPAVGDVAEVVMPGKADDYASPTSREYRLWGEGTIELAAEWADESANDRQERAEEMLGYYLKAYSHFINVYVMNKSHDDANADYCGFSSVVRQMTHDGALTPVGDDGLTWTFHWEIEIGGPNNLLSQLDVERRDDGVRTFAVKMPVLSESQLEGGYYSKTFDPDSYEGDLQDLVVAIAAEESSIDAYPQYQEMFADGKLEIGIIVGGDYNEARWDLTTAEELFDWLKGEGYQHPANAYTELTLDSPPFTGTFDADGETIALEITLLYPDIVPDAELSDLEDKIVEAYQTMDVLLYSGHAGLDANYSGVVYHYNPRHAISAFELAKRDLPDKYQLYLFSGCKTYSAYPDAVYTSETKTTANLDIISTVSFGWSSMRTETNRWLIEKLIATRSGTHDPLTYLEILKRVNAGGNRNVYYGVHGLDDNPHLNPYADLDTLCQACTTSSECPGEGNRCVSLGAARACAAECTDDDGCPEGYKCNQVADSGWISGKQCVPTSYQCESP
ncbi:MAG: hypothetical protein JRI23_32495 [Deltaproteobacteria bacterium]|jgi:hypothetical protein|nr:hypothetical protein [Deltaproteobacteria bacterium]MBW2536965.1 hypothetical protein [Deltaproteobacteria bacterium]